VNCEVPAGITNCHPTEEAVDITLSTVTNTVDDPCSTNPAWICTLPTFNLWNHAAALNFSLCTKIASTGYVYAAASAPTNCFDTTFTPRDTGLTNGWNLVATTNAPPASYCYTNFAKYRVPWSGDTTTNAMGWAVTNGLLLQRWSFVYH
jgi:hypothetical protein